jgi:hypothetical protein
MDPSSTRARPLHALALYAEPLAVGRRVVVVGDATLGLDARLLEVGARLVHVYDPDAARARSAAHASTRAIVRELPPGELDVRDGAFDLAIVPDLTFVPDPAALLARVRRLVGPEGAAIVAAANRERPGTDAARSLDYYDLFDLVSMQFADVRMIAALPFVGVALVELGDEGAQPDVSVDTQLAGDAPMPEVFVAVASQGHASSLDPYAIYMLPPEAVARGEQAAALEAARVELAETELRAKLLESQLDEQRTLLTKLASEEMRGARTGEAEAELEQVRARVRDAEARGAEAHTRAERLQLDVRALEEELQRQRDRSARLMSEAEQAKGTTAAAAARIEELEHLAAHRSEQLAALAGEVEATRAAAVAGQVAAQELELVAARADRADKRAALLEAELATAGEGLGEELGRLEAALRERAHTVKELEMEVVRRERMLHELVAALEEARAAAGREPPDGESIEPEEAVPTDPVRAPEPAEGTEVLDAENALLREKLDALALDFARREGEAQATAWRIAELERELEASREAGPSDPRSAVASAATDDIGRKLTAALDELDILRRALAQEHEARARAESGEGLAQARVELQRQATLIEQLSRELEARDRTRPVESHGPD